MTESKRHQKRLILFGLITLFWMGFIFLMSAQNGEKSGLLSNGFLGSLLGSFLERLLPSLTDQGAGYDIRKYAHMFEYLCLAVSSFSFLREWMHGKERNLPMATAAAWLFSFLYACSDEWHQTFAPGRSGQFSDVLVDMVGFTVGIAGALLWCLLRKKKQNG